MKVADLFEAKYESGQKSGRRPTFAISRLVRKAASDNQWEITDQRNDKRANDHRMCWWTYRREPNKQQRDAIKARVDRDMARGNLPGETRWRQVHSSHIGPYWKFEVIGVPLEKPDKEKEIRRLKQEKQKLYKTMFRDEMLTWQEARNREEQTRINRINREIDQLREAKYQESNERTLEGWFIAGNKNAQIKITIGDCSDQWGGDTLCRIVDWESKGTLVHHYRDGLEPGTQISYGESKTTHGVPERAWYIMPTSDATTVGWFIRGPNLPYEPNDVTDRYVNEAKYQSDESVINKAMAGVDKVLNTNAPVHLSKFQKKGPDEFLEVYKELHDRFGEPEFEKLSSQSQMSHPVWRVAPEVKLILTHVGISVVRE